MPKATAAAVKHHHDLIWHGDAKALRQGVVHDVLAACHLDLQIVVARAQGADLVEAALDGSVADLRGVGADNAAGLFGALQVLLPAITDRDAPARSFCGTAADILVRGRPYA